MWVTYSELTGEPVLQADRERMTPLQQENVEFIRALRKELQHISGQVANLMKRMEEGTVGRKEVGYASTSLISANVAFKDALGEIGREEYQREE